MRVGSSAGEIIKTMIVQATEKFRENPENLEFDNKKYLHMITEQVKYVHKLTEPLMNPECATYIDPATLGKLPAHDQFSESGFALIDLSLSYIVLSSTQSYREA